MSLFGDPAETPEVLALLMGARQARSDPETAERAVRQALAAAPEDFEAQLGAYRFYFYNHRYAEALPHAAVLMNLIARRLNVAADWRAVRPGDAAFDEPEEAPGLYLQALIAWGYCQARLGARREGAEAIAKAVELNPRDRFGVGDLIAVALQPEPSEEE